MIKERKQLQESIIPSTGPGTRVERRNKSYTETHRKNEEFMNERVVSMTVSNIYTGGV